MSELTFTQKLKRLEEIVRQLESPDMEIEQGLKLLEEGVKLHQECQSMLTETQAKITKLLDANQAEPLVSEPVTEETHHHRPERPAAVEEAADLFASAQVEVSRDTGESESDDGLPF